MGFSKIYIEHRFGQIPNGLLNNQGISLKSKGLYGYMQSKPDGREFSAKKIANQTKDGIKSIQNGLKELEENGYLIREKIRENGEFKGINYIITVEPFRENAKMDILKQENISKKELSKKELSNKQDTLNNKQKKKNKCIMQNLEIPFDNLEIVKTIKEYNLNRKKKLEKLTEKGRQLFFKKLKKLGNTDAGIIKVLEQSIENGRQGIFEIKDKTFDTKDYTDLNTFGKEIKRDYSGLKAKLGKEKFFKLKKERLYLLNKQ